MWRLWGPVVAYAALIFVLSSIPNLKPPTDVTNADKAAHFLEYTLFGLLLFRAGRFTWSDRSVWLPIGFTIFTGLVVAMMDEVYQGRVGRQQSFQDFLADSSGVLAATLAGYLVTRVPGRMLRSSETK
ncbi:MAG TPA: VanZ family protein [Candidatus Eisenbacteria bacterium]|nr:VanZ family protein [Candidatus Eisenbacteria bacterium]